ncbi:hypothetical protein CMK11_06725 [Candidatus Poribacteria bacterium]|nr:hypothetical protein [Candidatus Poribacteria bacterium]
MRFVSILAFTVALATSAAAGDLLIYLDFEQTPPQHPYFLASELEAGFSFDPLELKALERALAGSDGRGARGFSFDPLDLDALEQSLAGGRDDGGRRGFSFNPLELDALERSLVGRNDDARDGFAFDPLDLDALERSLARDPFIESLHPPTVSFTGRALDRSGGRRDTLALGNVILLADDRSKAARFDRKGRLQFFSTTWWPDVAPKRAMSVLGWVNVHELRPDGVFLDLGTDGGDDPIFVGDLIPDDVPFEPPVGLFPYVTQGSVLHWSLHSDDWSPIFTLDGPITVGEWFHVAGTYDATEGSARLYVNGEEVATAHGDAELGVYAGPTGIVTINSPPYGSTWSLDDLNIWGCGLSGDEVRSVMQFGPTVDNATAVDDGDTVTTWGALKAR